MLYFLKSFSLAKLDTKQIFMFIAVIFFLVVSYLFQLNSKKNVFAKIPQQEYMENFTLSHYSDAGKIKDTLHANYWAYVPGKEVSTLKQPQLHLFKNTSAEWLVSADTGMAHHTSLQSKVSKIELSGNVIIKRLENKVFTPVIMKTDFLTYFPEEELIETDKFVSMEKPGLVITGVGTKGDLKNNLISLLENVKTKYHKGN